MPRRASGGGPRLPDRSPAGLDVRAGWNQAYQYDTLPIDLKFEEMQPGDLIFYSGIYFNTKCRQQKHNMVHVEVFTGGETGE